MTPLLGLLFLLYGIIFSDALPLLSQDSRGCVSACEIHETELLKNQCHLSCALLLSDPEIQFNDSHIAYFMPSADVCASNQLVPAGKCIVSVVGICCQWTRGGKCWKVSSSSAILFILQAQAQIPYDQNTMIGPVEEFFESPDTAVRMSIQGFFATFPAFAQTCLGTT